MSIIAPDHNLGLFFGIIEYNNLNPTILWSGSTWHSEIQTWDLLLKILAIKDNLEEVEWGFLPIIWDEVEIFALTKAFQIKGIGSAYLVVFHQSAEKLTQFILTKEEEMAETFREILTSSAFFSIQQLTNEQLKQIRIRCQAYYEILSQI
ncbi:MAG: hypothetical protein JSU57_05985 [Candidatus Heimdallarchaeota archaeon]|nr:MAG: hypothetical protein JSU57_05985 [Candidatus Heimdallarchaeota archaeon]